MNPPTLFTGTEGYLLHARECQTHSSSGSLLLSASLQVHTFAQRKGPREMGKCTKKLEPWATTGPTVVHP